MTEEHVVSRCRELTDSISFHRAAISRDSAERRVMITMLHEQFGLTYRQISEKLLVSEPRVSQILNGVS